MSVKKMVKGLKGFAGFTLVELMVVVAIIGILAAIAVPNFKKYQAKAKTGEATLALASLYTGEQSVLLATDTYVACVAALSLETPIQGYYVVGFGTAASAMGKTNAKVPNCSPGTTPSSISSSQGQVLSNGNMGDALSPTDYLVVPAKLMQVGKKQVSPGDFSITCLGATAACSSGSGAGASGNDTFFVASAQGSIAITSNSAMDVWTIDETKSLKITSQGY